MRGERRYGEHAQAASSADAARRKARRCDCGRLRLCGRRAARRAGGARSRHGGARRHLRLPASPTRIGRHGAGTASSRSRAICSDGSSAAGAHEPAPANGSRSRRREAAGCALGVLVGAAVARETRARAARRARAAARAGQNRGERERRARAGARTRTRATAGGVRRARPRKPAEQQRGLPATGARTAAAPAAGRIRRRSRSARPRSSRWCSRSATRSPRPRRRFKASNASASMRSPPSRPRWRSLASGQTLLSRETRNLVTALRRPDVRGRWGEITLKRLVELSGMSAHVDFTEQRTGSTESGAIRPDMIVHMPERRDIVVDVKTPLDAYLAAVEAQTEEDRGASCAVTRSWWARGCANWPRNSTGRNSNRARISWCCSCRAISSCPRRCRRIRD